jgi:hypothetical protein
LSGSETLLAADLDKDPTTTIYLPASIKEVQATEKPSALQGEYSALKNIK